MLVGLYLASALGLTAVPLFNVFSEGLTIRYIKVPNSYSGLLPGIGYITLCYTQAQIYIFISYIFLGIFFLMVIKHIILPDLPLK